MRQAVPPHLWPIRAPQKLAQGAATYNEDFGKHQANSILQCLAVSLRPGLPAVGDSDSANNAELGQHAPQPFTLTLTSDFKPPGLRSDSINTP